MGSQRSLKTTSSCSRKHKNRFSYSCVMPLTETYNVVEIGDLAIVCEERKCVLVGALGLFEEMLDTRLRNECIHQTEICKVEPQKEEIPADSSSPAALTPQITCRRSAHHFYAHDYSPRLLPHFSNFGHFLCLGTSEPQPHTAHGEPDVRPNKIPSADISLRAIQRRWLPAFCACPPPVAVGSSGRPARKR